MANEIIELPSGARLEIQMANFEKGHRLLKAVMKEIESVNVSLGDVNLASFKNILQAEIPENLLNTIKNLLSRVMSSDGVDAALWDCMGTCLYNNIKINRDTFDPEEAREDFIPVSKEVLVYNLAPFFKNLNSLLSVPGKRTIAGQK